MNEDIELEDFGNRIPRTDDNETPQTEESSFGGTDNIDHIVSTDPNDGLQYSDRQNRIIASKVELEKIRRNILHIDMVDFFTKTLVLGPECTDVRFMDYLLDSNVLSIRKNIDGYSVRYLGGEFRSIGTYLEDGDSKTLRDGINEYYREWRKKMLDRAMKRSGVIAGVGIGLIALVTGLSVGLTRKGADIKHAGKERRKWEKLTGPTVVPWADIEEAGGDALIFVGEYLTVILAVSAVYLTVRRRGISQ